MYSGGAGLAQPGSASRGAHPAETGEMQYDQPPSRCSERARWMIGCEPRQLTMRYAQSPY